MKVTEIEELVQKITEQIVASCLLEKSEYTLACDQPLEQLPNEVTQQKIHWVTTDQENAQGLVVKELTVAQLASIASLQVSDETTKQVQGYLLAGKPVWVLQTNWPQKTNHLRYGLRQQLTNLKTQVERYGVNFLAPGESLAFEQLKKPVKARTKGKFITEKELQAYIQQKDFQLPKDCRLTPLAVDYAREHSITI